MSTPRYVATKVGGQYELIREDSGPMAGRVAWAVVGGALVAYGLARRNTGGLLVLGLGAASFYLAFSQPAPPPAEDQPVPHEPCAPLEEMTPSYAHNETPTTQLPRDQIDEASMESFPASDAPSYA